MADGSPAFHANRPIFHSLSQCAECGVGGDDFMSPNTEAFEVTGELYCGDCAGDVLARLAAEEDDEDPEYAAPTAGELWASERTWGL